MSGMSEEKEEAAEAAEAETATAMTSELIVGGRDLELLEEGRPLNGILVEVGIHKVMRGEETLPLQSRKKRFFFWDPMRLWFRRPKIGSVNRTSRGKKGVEN